MACDPRFGGQRRRPAGGGVARDSGLAATEAVLGAIVPPALAAVGERLRLERHRAGQPSEAPADQSPPTSLDAERARQRVEAVRVHPVVDLASRRQAVRLSHMEPGES